MFGYDKDKLIDAVTTALDKVGEAGIDALNIMVYDHMCSLDNIQENVGQQMGAEWLRVGCSKAVFKLPEFDWVVFKIPFYGECDLALDEYNEDMSDNDIVDLAWAQVDKFSHANDGGLYPTEDWDYCGAESYIYKKAIDAGLDQYFFGTLYLTDYYDVPIYVSEKADRDYWEEETDSEYKLYSEKSLNDSQSFPDATDEPGITAIFLEQYGAKEFSKIYDFIKKWDIKDLHSGNVLFSNDWVAFSDYSSYREG